MGEPKRRTLKLFLICCWLSTYGRLWLWHRISCADETKHPSEDVCSVVEFVEKKNGAVSKQVGPPYNPHSFWPELDLMCWAHFTALWRDNAPLPNVKTFNFLLFAGKNKLSLFPSFGSERADSKLSLQQLEKCVELYLECDGTFCCCCQPVCQRCSRSGLEWLSVKIFSCLKNHLGQWVRNTWPQRQWPSQQNMFLVNSSSLPLLFCRCSFPQATAPSHFLHFFLFW